MYNAPSASFPVGRSRFYAWLSLGLWSILVAAGIAWQGQAGQPLWPRLLMFAAVPVSAWMLIRSWQASRVGRLCWTGHDWLFDDGQQAHAVTVSVALEFQRVLLVQCRFEPKADSWLWLEARSQPEAWRAIRRAIFHNQASRQEGNPLFGSNRPPDLNKDLM